MTIESQPDMAAAEVVLDDVEMEPVEDDSQIYAPPAHIAARIYKKNTTDRCKSSAASSRRSSVSSRHSHQSVLSAHGGPQSNHVAQHLRRASIIESRKARLADRAAHVEQVRLRAALAKATPREKIRADRALAAQAAREKLLAEITARCEEEVRRAKKVAEETKEKKAAEIARLREEMEEKLADAAKRRIQYQQANRRPRTASLPRVEERKVGKAGQKQMTKVAAAKIIQRHWRDYHAVQVVQAFDALPVSVVQIKEMDFEEAGVLLSGDEVLAATAQILKLFGMLETDVDDMSERGSVRVFLSAFLVLGHPKQALSHGGSDAQEQELLAKAQELLKTFEKATRNTLSLKKASAPENLAFLFHTFTSTFHAWKSQDSTALVDVMVNQFVQLDLILQMVKDDTAGGVADEYHQAIKMNQIHLLARLKRFAGPEKALNLVKTAVRRARKQRAATQQTPSSKEVPRTASTSEPAPAISQPPVDNAIISQRPSSSHESQTANLMRHLRQSMTPIPSNREVAHEILINGFFEIQQRPFTEARKAFADSLRTAMREALEQGGDLAASGWITSMATLIRDRLMNLVSQRHPLYDRIDNFLDIKLIDQTARVGIFSYDSFFENIANILAQICSPGRDEAIKAFAEDREGDNIDRLFKLIDIIDLMSLDHINYAFRMAAPTVSEHGLEHEKSNFEYELSRNNHKLDATKDFWRRSRSVLYDESRARDANAAAPSGQAIYIRGLVDLVLSNRPLDSSSLPETLLLDQNRLLALRATAFKIAATASTLLTTKIRLRRNREVRWSADADRIMKLDFAEPTTDSQRIVSIIESSHLMPDATREGLLSFVDRVLPPASAAASQAAALDADKYLTRLFSKQSPETSPTTITASSDGTSSPSESTSSTSSSPPTVFTEPLAVHLLRSLHSHVLTRLSATSTAERVRTTTSAAEVLARAGMPEFATEVGKIVDTLERVRRVDLGSHGTWYDEIAREFETESTDA